MPEERLQLPPLQEIFQFKPKWWWDPIPWWLFDRLDRPAIGKLAQIQMELEQTVLEAQLKASKQALDLVRQMTK